MSSSRSRCAPRSICGTSMPAMAASTPSSWSCGLPTGKHVSPEVRHAELRGQLGRHQHRHAGHPARHVPQPDPTPAPRPAEPGARDLTDGEFVTVLVQGVAPDSRRSVIPRAAILSDQQGSYVWVVGRRQQDRAAPGPTRPEHASRRRSCRLGAEGGRDGGRRWRCSAFAPVRSSIQDRPPRRRPNAHFGSEDMRR